MTFVIKDNEVKKRKYENNNGYKIERGKRKFYLQKLIVDIILNPNQNRLEQGSKEEYSQDLICHQDDDSGFQLKHQDALKKENNHDRAIALNDVDVERNDNDGRILEDEV
jgi:hypothetical protein